MVYELISEIEKTTQKTRNKIFKDAKSNNKVYMKGWWEEGMRLDREDT